MSESEQLNPTALTIEQAARVLTASGSKPVTMQMLRNDIDARAPTNPDGTVNPVAFAARLVREMRRGEGPPET